MAAQTPRRTSRVARWLDKRRAKKARAGQIAGHLRRARDRAGRAGVGGAGDGGPFGGVGGGL
jgi:hypothetical protein